MRLIRDIDHRDVCDHSVVTIGNFDGLHLGHQALVRRCSEVRDQAGDGSRLAVVTFEPNPLALLAPDRAPARLYGVREKLEMLRDLGVDLVWMMRFNDRLATLRPAEFIERVLVRGLAARQVVLGEDFRFGHRREGDLGLMRQLGSVAGFAVEAVAPVTCDEHRISSTEVRAALAEGRLADAGKMLGRPYRMTGRVIRGQQLGRTLGYPTANVLPPAGRSPLTGIFAVRARTEDGRWWNGVANLGHRPAVGGTALLLEVHLFDFRGDLYGQRLETEFVSKLRDEQDFRSLLDLVEQMEQDERRARAELAAV